MTDIEMKPGEEKKKDEAKEGEEEKVEEKKLPPTVPEEIKINIALIERAVSTLEPRFTLRVLRTLAALRKRLDSTILAEAIDSVYPPGALSYGYEPGRGCNSCTFRLTRQEVVTVMAAQGTCAFGEDGNRYIGSNCTKGPADRTYS